MRCFQTEVNEEGGRHRCFLLSFTNCLEQLFSRTLAKDCLNPTVLLKTLKIKKQHFWSHPCQNGLILGTCILITANIINLLFLTTLTHKTLCQTCSFLRLVKHKKSNGRKQHCKLSASFFYHQLILFKMPYMPNNIYNIYNYLVKTVRLIFSEI